MSTPPSTEEHVAEHIPWEHLTVAPAPDRSRLLYGVAGTIVLAVVALIVFQAFDRRVTPVAPQPESVTAAAPVGVSLTTSPPVDLATPQVPAIVSEADLMAAGAAPVPQEVIARAEWVVLEFFTLDPGDDWAARVTAASSLAIPPELHPQPPQASTVSYVEWVRTYDVEVIGLDTFEATVIMRRLVALDGETYERLQSEWVTLQLGITEEGESFILSLPALTDPPAQELGDLEASAGKVDDSIGIGWPG